MPSQLYVRRQVSNPSYELESVPGGTNLIVRGAWNDHGDQMLMSGRADGLVLNYALGFQEPNLDFLRNWPIKRLVILDRSISDLSPISRTAATLTELSIETAPSAMIDLGELPLLSDLAAGWRQVRESIGCLDRLTRLFLLGFDEDDLTVFAVNKGLQQIKMKDRPKIKSLRGFKALHQLKSLEIHLASRLNNISDLRGVSNDSLQTLTLEMCRGITTTDELTDLKGLRSLNLSECGDLASIKPLVGLQNLEELHVYGTTKILDNDLMPILSLPHLKVLRIQSRRSYTPSTAQVQAGLPHGDATL